MDGDDRHPTGYAAEHHARQRYGRPLSPRELQLALLLAGRDEPQVKQAATLMGVSVETVNTMRARAYSKLGVHSRLGLLYALADMGHRLDLPPAPVDVPSALRALADGIDGGRADG